MVLRYLKILGNEYILLEKKKRMKDGANSKMYGKKIVS